MGKEGDLNYFEPGVVVGPSVSETACLLRFSHTSISRICTEWSEKWKSSSENVSDCTELNTV